MDPTWYTKFFYGVVVDMWRSAASPEQTRSDVDFLEESLQLRPGGRVLDVPCGFGRHSIELAGRGYRMTGIDVSDEMIGEARKLADEAGAAIEWRRAEMRNLAWTSEFDGAFCFGNSFGYLDRDGTRHFLEAVSHALKPGCRFVFDYGMAAECILPRFIEREWAPVDDLHFLEHNHYHIDEGCIETTYTFVKNGVAETRTGLHWVYTVAEIRAMLQDAGLAPVAQYRATDNQPFALGSEMLIVVAEKG